MAAWALSAQAKAFSIFSTMAFCSGKEGRIREKVDKSSSNLYELMEENLLKLAFVADINDKQKYFIDKIKDYKCQNEDNARILESIDKYFKEVNNVDELAKKLFLEFYNVQNVQKKISDNIFSSHEFNNLSLEDYKKAIDETISRLKKINEQQEKEKLKKMLKDENLSAEEKLQISAKIFKK